MGQSPVTQYVQRIPEFVEKINARDDFERAYKYGMKQIPFWVVLNDNDEVVAVSNELSIDTAIKWYQELSA